MKLHPLLTCAMLSMAFFTEPRATAQESASHEQSCDPFAPGDEDARPTARPAGPSDPNRLDVVTLDSGPLSEVVEWLEYHIEQRNSEHQEAPGLVLPNVIYADNCEKVLVPGDLKLRNITPVQALALIATAAGCAFEPIFAPLETAGQEETIIGYRFEPAKSNTTGKSPRSTGSDMSEGSAGGGFPSLGTLGKSAKAPDSIYLTKENPMVSKPALAVDPAGAGGDKQVHTSRFGSREPEVVSFQGFINEDSSLAARLANAPTTRIYSLGDSLGGDEKERLQGRENLQKLVEQALALAELKTKENPNMAFHEGAGALIVKATAQQHEIIQQAVSAMIESRSASSSGGSPSGR